MIRNYYDYAARMEEMARIWKRSIPTERDNQRQYAILCEMADYRGDPHPAPPRPIPVLSARNIFKRMLKAEDWPEKITLVALAVNFGSTAVSLYERLALHRYGALFVEKVQYVSVLVLILNCAYVYFRCNRAHRALVKIACEVERSAEEIRRITALAEDATGPSAIGLLQTYRTRTWNEVGPSNKGRRR